MEEYIESLLYTWREKGKFGLSLPFIVGALRLKGLLNSSASDSFDSVLNQLQQGSGTFRLAYCDKADDLILAPVNTRPDGCRQIYNSGHPTSLWIQHDVLANEGSDSVELFNAMWERYGNEVESERNSCTKGKYHQFKPDDMALIDEAFDKIA